LSNRKGIALAGLAALVVALFYVATWPFIVGEERMQDFCGSLSPGSPIAVVRGTVDKLGLQLAMSSNADSALVHDSNTFGRFICKLQFKSGVLVTARYQRND
jgi:hypothetical protein